MPISMTVIALATGAYCVLHSLLASCTAKAWARRLFGPRTDCWYRLAFNFVAVVTLLPVLVLIPLLPDRHWYTFPAPWWQVALFLQAITLLSLVYGVWITDAWHFLGLRQLSETSPQGCSRKQPPLAVFGLYRWVRHPLYALSLVLIWLTPYMTYNLAALWAVFSIYLVVGPFFEERRLVGEFGEAYEQYRRQVPRLIPWRGPVAVKLAVQDEQSSRRRAC